MCKKNIKWLEDVILMWDRTLEKPSEKMGKNELQKIFEQKFATMSREIEIRQWIKMQ